MNRSRIFRNTGPNRVMKKMLPMARTMLAGIPAAAIPMNESIVWVGMKDAHENRSVNTPYANAANTAYIVRSLLGAKDANPPKSPIPSIWNGVQGPWPRKKLLTNIVNAPTAKPVVNPKTFPEITTMKKTGLNSMPWSICRDATPIATNTPVTATVLGSRLFSSNSASIMSTIMVLNAIEYANHPEPVLAAIREASAMSPSHSIAFNALMFIFRHPSESHPTPSP